MAKRAKDPKEKEAEEGEEDDSEQPWWATALAVIFLVGLVVGTVLIIRGILPHKLSPERNPSFLDNIFDSRVVIAAIRIALLFAAVYVMASIVGLMIDRRWLSQLGPFRASEPIAKVDDTAEQLRDELKDALETIDNLSGRLEASDEELSKAHDDIQFLLEHIDTMEKAGD